MSFTSPPGGVPTPPPAPSRNDAEDVFDEKANNMVAWYTVAMSWFTTFISWVSTFVTELGNYQVLINNYQLAAQQAAIAAETSAQTAAGVSGAVMWVSGNSYAFGSFVWSPTSLLTYRRSTPGTTVSTVDPATGTASGWKLANAVSSMPQVEINTAGAYALLSGYHYRVKNPGAILTMPAAGIQEQIRVEDVSDGTTVQIWPEAGGKFKNRDVALLLSDRGFDRTFTKTADGWV